MDFYVVLNRPGYRVAKRKAKCAKIGYQHKVTKTDAVKWFQVCTIVRTVDALFCVPSLVILYLVPSYIFRRTPRIASGVFKPPA